MPTATYCCYPSVFLRVVAKSLLGLDEFSHRDIEHLKPMVYKNQEIFVFCIFQYMVHLHFSIIYYVLV